MDSKTLLKLTGSLTTIEILKENIDRIYIGARSSSSSRGWSLYDGNSVDNDTKLPIEKEFAKKILDEYKNEIEEQIKSIIL